MNSQDIKNLIQSEINKLEETKDNDNKKTVDVLRALKDRISKEELNEALAVANNKPKFKEITAYYLQESKDLNLKRILTIKRCLSGANEYGDRSCHILYINGEFFKQFDTRYNEISDYIDEWLNQWEIWNLENWDKRILTTLLNYDVRYIEYDKKEF